MIFELPSPNDVKASRDREGADKRRSNMRQRFWRRVAFNGSPSAPLRSRLAWTCLGDRVLPRLGFTLIEAVISIAIVGGLLAASLRVAGSAVVARAKAAEQSRGLAMARSLMSEILAQSYQEPVSAVVFGLEAGESQTNRTTLDDVDDYHNLNESPPKNRDGTTVYNAGNWTRSTKVEWVSSSTLTQTTASASETGVKRVTVTVSHRGVVVAKLVGFKCNLS